MTSLIGLLLYVLLSTHATYANVITYSYVQSNCIGNKILAQVIATGICLDGTIVSCNSGNATVQTYTNSDCTGNVSISHVVLGCTNNNQSFIGSTGTVCSSDLSFPTRYISLQSYDQLQCPLDSLQSVTYAVTNVCINDLFSNTSQKIECNGSIDVAVVNYNTINCQGTPNNSTSTIPDGCTNYYSSNSTGTSIFVECVQPPPPVVSGAWTLVLSGISCLWVFLLFQ